MAGYIVVYFVFITLDTTIAKFVSFLILNKSLLRIELSFDSIFLQFKLNKTSIHFVNLKSK